MSLRETVQVRSAVRSDAARLREIGIRGWETTYADFIHAENRRTYLNSDFWSLERLQAVIDEPEAINLAVEQDGIVIGFITTEKLDNGRYEVTRLYVDPEIRSKGIGGKMLQMVFDELRERGVAEVLVNVFGDNHAGRRFYERNGFELIEDTWCMVGDQQLSDVWYSQRFERK
jgi:ribosomal protein S18 acetylase RimI-like enzyme